MRSILGVGLAVALFGFAAPAAHATTVTLPTSTSGSFTVTATGANPPSSMTLDSNGTVSGPGYSFSNVDITLGSCTAGGGCVGPPDTGTDGTLTVGGITYNLDWTVIDGDGAGLVMDFTGTGPAGASLVPLSDFTLNTTTTFATLFANSGSASAGISSGEVNTAQSSTPLPGALPLFGSVLAGGAWLMRRKRKSTVSMLPA